MDAFCSFAIFTKKRIKHRWLHLMISTKLQTGQLDIYIWNFLPTENIQNSSFHIYKNVLLIQDRLQKNETSIPQLGFDASIEIIFQSLIIQSKPILHPNDILMWLLMFFLNINIPFSFLGKKPCNMTYTQHVMRSSIRSLKVLIYVTLHNRIWALSKKFDQFWTHENVEIQNLLLQRALLNRNWTILKWHTFQYAILVWASCPVSLY